MFPRISKSTKNGKSYEYLVISESIHVTGKGSTTRNIANLGNIKQFKRQDVANLIDGFIRIFKLENYCLSEDVQLLESLEHGSIIFWQKIWDELGLSKTIKSQVKVKNKRIKLEVEKYVQMMVINRCVDPLRHWLQVRVRAHVFICVLALLLKRIFEIHYMKSKSTMEPLEEISESKLIKYKVKFSKREDRSQTFPKVTNTTPMQKKYFNMIGIKNPMSLEKFIW